MNQKQRNLMNELGRDKLPDILIASSECAPLSKTGGLADVAGALPKSLAKLGFDVRVITPFHRCAKNIYATQTEHLCDFSVNLGWKQEYVGIEKLVIDGVTFYLVDNEYYFGSDKIYWGGDGEIEQYAYFSRAVLEAIPLLDFQPEVLHCNDWQTAIMPVLIKTQYQGRPQGGLRTLLTLHNMHFQGNCDFGQLASLLGLDSGYMGEGCLGYYGRANQMKGGLIFADKINTVSPSYAQEIRTPMGGEGLHGVLEEHSYKLSGIINGLDYKVFNPWTDPNLPTHYSAKKRSGKAKCKQALCERLGLDISPDTPIIAMVTRMTDQKGFNLVMQGMEEIVNMGAAFVLLGTGDAGYEQFMRQAEYSHKGRVVSYIGYDPNLANLIYGGADFYLMPSLFEPCGLSQMIAMRYGAIPIVRATGGLKDTVSHFDGTNGTGFLFYDYTAGGMLGAVYEALQVYQDKPAMEQLVQNAMSTDFSFDLSAQRYADLYLELIRWK